MIIARKWSMDGRIGAKKSAQAEHVLVLRSR
jgi:hypothetical protein